MGRATDRERGHARFTDGLSSKSSEDPSPRPHARAGLGAPTRPMPPVETDIGDDTLEKLLEQRERFRGPRHGPDVTRTQELPTSSMVREEPWPDASGHVCWS